MNSKRTSAASGASDQQQGSRTPRPSGRDDKQPSATEPDQVVCRTCGAVHSSGRWQWLSLSARQETRRVRCPACLRVRANDPAGVLTLVGSFVRLHAEELGRLIRYHEARQRQRDSQSRIVRIRRMLDRIDVSTTDTHLPLRIGEAVVAAHGGTLHTAREKDGGAMRVRWLSEEIGATKGPSEGPPAVRGAACTSTRSQRTMTERWPSMAPPVRRHSTR